MTEQTRCIFGVPVDPRRGPLEIQTLVVCNQPIRQKAGGEGWEHFGRACLHQSCKVNHRPHVQDYGHPATPSRGTDT